MKFLQNYELSKSCPANQMPLRVVNLSGLLTEVSLLVPDDPEGLPGRICCLLPCPLTVAEGVDDAVKGTLR